MTLESTVVCVDNSEYCRNGDFIPTRLSAQSDAANLICRSKIRSNPENCVGLLQTSNNQLVATLTTDAGKLGSVISKLEPEGETKFSSAVRVAQLSLKHRMNKHHKQRIVLFICSPIVDEEKEIIKIAKRLKKEKVSLDIVSFGEDEVNQSKLSAFIATLNGKDGGSSHLVSIPAGTSLSEALRKSPIVDGGEGGGGASGGFDMDIDPSTDPELAMALRISLEEQRARTQQQGQGGESEGQQNEGQQPMDEDQQMLRAALDMSINPEGASQPSGGQPNMGDLAAMTEEEQIAYALQMSMQPDEQPMEQDATPTQIQDESQQLVTDPAFLQSVLENLPGVDPNSDEIQRAMGAQGSSDDKDKKEKKDNNENK